MRAHVLPGECRRMQVAASTIIMREPLAKQTEEEDSQAVADQQQHILGGRTTTLANLSSTDQKAAIAATREDGELNAVRNCTVADLTKECRKTIPIFNAM